jgi:hypothetical protein
MYRRVKLKIHCGVYDANMATVLYRFLNPEGSTGEGVLSLKVLYLHVVAPSRQL